MTMLTLITPAPIEAITLAEAKVHCRIDGDAENTLLAGYIAAACQEAAAKLNRVLVESTWEWTLDAFPACGAALELPLSPATAVESITYVDAAGVTQTLDEAAYRVFPAGLVLPAPLMGSVRPLAGEEWPVGTDVVITFRAGWPVEGEGTEEAPYVATTPAAIRSWILLRVGGLYANRESHREARNTGMAFTEMPRTFADSLLDAWTIVGVA